MPGRQASTPSRSLRGDNDARIGMPLGIPRGAMCVQRFDDSLNSAIHITYRISLRSSSMPEPRDPLLKVLNIKVCTQTILIMVWVWGSLAGTYQPKPVARRPAKATKVRYTQGGRSTREGMNSVMILPQVHLRKPCYDFYFL